MFSLISWLFKRFDYLVPLIGILLGGMAEERLLLSYQISFVLWRYLVDRPVTIFSMGC